MGVSLLIIEDEPAILDFLSDNLRQDDHRVVGASTQRSRTGIAR